MGDRINRSVRINKDTDYKEFLEQQRDDFEQKYEKIIKSGAINYDKIEKIQVLGIGAFGVVFLVKSRADGYCYAMKQSLKANIVRQKQVLQSIREKRLLGSVNFPFLVYLDYAFKDNDFVYFLMPFINGGELFSYLRRVGRIAECETRFYASQVLLALEYLHMLSIIYRDLKPENILIDYRGYLRITDFGFCKIINGRTYTLCGTPEYLAPEVIKTKGYGFIADWWALGVLMYEMAAGVSPFYRRDKNDHMSLYARILDAEYDVPRYFSSEFSDLIKQFLQTDVTRRLGNLKNGVDDIKSHPFFRSINWIRIFNKEVEPDYLPKVQHGCDCSFFEPDNEPKFVLSNTCQYENEFSDF